MSVVLKDAAIWHNKNQQQAASSQVGIYSS